MGMQAMAVRAVTALSVVRRRRPAALAVRAVLLAPKGWAGLGRPLVLLAMPVQAAMAVPAESVGHQRF